MSLSNSCGVLSCMSQPRWKLQIIAHKSFLQAFLQKHPKEIALRFSIIFIFQFASLLIHFIRVKKCYIKENQPKTPNTTI